MVRQAVLTVNIQAYSWISQTLGLPENSDRIIKVKAKEGSTLDVVFTELAGTYPEFRKNVFDPENGQVSEHVLVILNNKLVQYSEIKTTSLQDQDTITLAPMIFGG